MSLQILYVNLYQRRDGEQFIGSPPTPVRSFLDGRSVWTRDGEPVPRRIGVLRIKMKDQPA